jgi:hypothetical protein
MRTEKGYRFSLQFPGNTKEQRQIGEYLERLRSKKSRFVVEALREYLSAHPEKWKTGTGTCCDAGGFSREDLREIVREVLAERGMVIQLLDDAWAAAESSVASIKAVSESLGHEQRSL